MLPLFDSEFREKLNNKLLVKSKYKVSEMLQLLIELELYISNNTKNIIKDLLAALSHLLLNPKDQISQLI